MGANAVNQAKAKGWSDLCFAFIMPAIYNDGNGNSWSDTHINKSGTYLQVEYEGAYGMPEVGIGNGQNGTFKTTLGSTITVKYPTKMYLDISENLSDAGYSINVACNGNNRMIVFPSVWGGQEFGNPTSGVTSAGSDAILKGQNTIINAFDNYGIQLTGAGKFENETIDKEYTTVLLCDNASQYLNSGNNYALQGKPSSVGEYRYYLTGYYNTSQADPNLTYMGGGGTTYVSSTNYIQGNVDFTIYVYDKSALNTAIINNTLADSESVKYTDSSWNDYKNALTNAQNILKTREVTQSDINTAKSNLERKRNALQLKTFTVTFDVPTGVSPVATKLYKYEDLLGDRFDVPTRPGYTFVRWYADNDNDGKYTT